MASTQQLPPSSLDHDSGWEYEYDESQTETFYVTLDLPLTRPRTRKAHRSEGDSAPSQPGNSTQGPIWPRPIATGDPKASAAGSSTGIDSAPGGEKHDGGNSSSGTGVPNGDDGIQVLDFHTRNPLVSFQGQIYSCAWSTTIGTDVLLTHPSSAIPFEPELKLEGVNVLASTGIKLLGTPVQLVPKKNARTNHTTRKAEVAAINEVLDQRQRRATPAQQRGDSQQQGDTTMSDVAKGKQPEKTTIEEASPAPVTEPLRLPIGPQNGRAKNLQARFLERIANAKARKGDTDQIILTSRRKLTGSGWRNWYGQKAAESRKAGQEGNDDEDESETQEQDDAEANGGLDAPDPEAPEEDPERPRHEDEEMRDDNDEQSIDSDDPEELLFPTKQKKKKKKDRPKTAPTPDAPALPPPANSTTTFAAAKELYLAPAEREGALRSEEMGQRGEGSGRGRGRERGRRGGGSERRGGRASAGSIPTAADAEDAGAEDGDVLMGGT